MTDSTQLSLSDYKKDNFINKIINIDIDRLTPIDSLTILNNLIQDAIDLKEN